MTGTGGDPLVSSIASVLRVPLLELYALLWRAGVVEIRNSEREARRDPAAAPGLICPDPSAHVTERRSRPSPPRRR
ncbi:Rv1535 domain-containing protein, partial [Mycobacterium paraintracellulare]|uniref:Rv1535 domain-containing protein n=1 Tax=Mycobacterium paraintracellulare TaxID=1138383 RepID=UPI0022AA6061